MMNKKFSMFLASIIGLSILPNFLYNMMPNLHEIAATGTVQVMREALSLGGTNINAKNIIECTPLYSAILYESDDERVAMVDFLLEKRADPRIGDASGLLPLHTAVSRGNKKIIKLLLKDKNIRNATINKQADIGYTPLDRAILLENVEIVRLLLENGANPNIADNNKHTPLFKILDDLKLASILSGSNKLSLIQMLMEYGANPTLVLGSASPFHHIQSSVVDFSHLGLYGGGIILITESRAPFHLLFENHRGLSPEIVNRVSDILLCYHANILKEITKVLLEMPVELGNLIASYVACKTDDTVDINVRDLLGRTLLMLAEQANNKKLVNKLIYVGADVTLQDNNRQKSNRLRQRKWT